MPIIIDATVGGTSSNSYVTLAEANDFFIHSTNVLLWTPATDEVKKAALVEATRDIDTYFEWVGLISNVNQALSWPRKLTDFRGSEYGYTEVGYGYQLDTNPADGTIPQIIKEATCKLALKLVSGGYRIEDANIDELKVGPIGIKFSKNFKTSGFPKEIIEMLLRIGIFIVSGNNKLKIHKLSRT